MSSRQQASDENRDGQIRSLVNNYLAQRGWESSCHDAEFVAAHPDLGPQLAEHLALLREVHAGRQPTVHPSTINRSQTVVIEPTGSSAGLSVRCPFCHELVDLDTNENWSAITCRACGSSFEFVGTKNDSNDLQVGRSIGRFQLVRRLGQGGFGSIWEAYDPQLDRTVAVKTPRRGELTAEEIEWFLREARTAAQVKHPNVVATHEVGRDGDRVYIVSDLVIGESLSQRLARRRYSIHEALQLILTIARTLQVVHNHGVIHRDLKPQNIMIDGEDQPHITDFGLAKRDAGEMTMTMDGQVLGTPAYMPPEQARGDAHQADARSDIYSLGVVLFELVTGELPFRGNPRMLIQQILNDEPPSPRKFNSNVPKDLATICTKCLQKDAKNRYDTAEELADDLDRHMSGEPILARPAGQIERTWRWFRRKPAVASVVALAAMLMVGTAIGAMFFAYQQRQIAKQTKEFGETQAVSAQLEAAARKKAELSERQRREELYVSRMTAIQHAAETNDIHRAGQLLESLVPVLDEPDLRGFEWYYWRQQTRRGLLWELGPFGRMQAVAVAPNGEWLAFGGQDKLVTIKNLRTDESFELKMTDQNFAPLVVYSLAFSPDSRWLAIGTDGQSVQVMDTSTREIVQELETEGRWIQDVEFSRDGKLLVAAVHHGPDIKKNHEGGRLELWTDLDPSTHRVIHVTETTVRSLVISPDGNRIVTIGGPYLGPSDGEIHLLDAETGQILAKRDFKVKRGWGTIFSPDRTSVFNSNDTAIEVLDAATLDTIRSFAQSGKSIFNSIAISPDGKLLVGGGKDGSLMSWSLPDGEPAKTWPGHLDQVMDISIFPDGEKMVTCSLDGYVKCWSLKVPDDAHLLTELHKPIRQLLFSPDGKVFYVAPQDGQSMALQAHAVDSGEPLWRIDEEDLTLASICLDPAGETLIVGMGGGKVRFIDAATGKLIVSKREHRGDRNITSCCVSPNGRWLVTGENPSPMLGMTNSLTEEVLLWDLAARKVIYRWLAHDRIVRHFLFGPTDDELVTYGWDKRIRRWRIPAGELIAEYTMGLKNAAGLAFANEQRTLVAVDYDGSLWRWSLPEGVQQPVIRSREGFARQLWMNEQDQTLLIPFGSQSGDVNQHGMVKFVDTRTWETKTIMDTGPGAAYSVAMSPDGSTLIVGNESGKVYRWRVDRSGQ